MIPLLRAASRSQPSCTACRPARHPPEVKKLYLPEILIDLIGQEVMRAAQQAMLDASGQRDVQAGIGHVLVLDEAVALDKGAEAAAARIAKALDSLQCGKHGCKWHRVEHVVSQVITTGGPEETRVIRVQCTHPVKGGKCELRYDGANDDIFNLYDDIMFQQAVLNKHYIELMHGSPFNRMMSVERDYERLLAEHKRRPLPSLDIFIEATVRWSALVRREDPSPCPVCGQYPAIIIGDGTGLRLKNSLFDELRAFGSPTVDAATAGLVPPEDGYDRGWRLPLVAEVETATSLHIKRYLLFALQ